MSILGPMLGRPWLRRRNARLLRDADRAIDETGYVAAGGMASADSTTLITGNHASTSDDDVYGDLGSDPRARGGSLRAEAVTRLFALPGIIEAIVGDLGIR